MKNEQQRELEREEQEQQEDDEHDNARRRSRRPSFESIAALLTHGASETPPALQILTQRGLILDFGLRTNDTEVAFLEPQMSDWRVPKVWTATIIPQDHHQQAAT